MTGRGHVLQCPVLAACVCPLCVAEPRGAWSVFTPFSFLTDHSVLPCMTALRSWVRPSQPRASPAPCAGRALPPPEAGRGPGGRLWDVTRGRGTGGAAAGISELPHPFPSPEPGAKGSASQPRCRGAGGQAFRGPWGAQGEGQPWLGVAPDRGGVLCVEGREASLARVCGKAEACRCYYSLQVTEGIVGPGG